MDLTETEQKKIKRIIILHQCVGLLALYSFQNGSLFTFLNKLNISPASIFLILTLPDAMKLFFMIPAGYYSDRFGKKLIGGTGHCIAFIGFALLIFIPLLPQYLQIYSIYFAIFLFSVGTTIFQSNWIALLTPIINKEIRGRFFAVSRIFIHLVNIIFSFIITFLLKKFTGISMYQAIFSFIAIMLFFRIILYTKVPDINKTHTTNEPLLLSLKNILKTPGLLPFSCYLFIIMLLTGACPLFFNFLEKDVLGFSEDQIVLLGSFMGIGALFGLFLGGKLVDKFGTKMIFLFSHFAYSFVLFFFVLRDFIPFSTFIYITILVVIFGIIRAISMLAVTSEIMALLPKKGMSLALAFAFTLLCFGKACASVVSSNIIKLKILTNNWILFGNNMSQYDALILGCSITILLVVVTLGLIPSVIGTNKPQVIPGTKL